SNAPPLLSIPDALPISGRLEQAVVPQAAVAVSDPVDQRFVARIAYPVGLLVRGAVGVGVFRAAAHRVEPHFPDAVEQLVRRRKTDRKSTRLNSSHVKSS